MADESPSVLPPWALLVLIPVLGGGVGSYVGLRSIDNVPSERLARMEATIAELRTDLDEFKRPGDRCPAWRCSNIETAAERTERSIVALQQKQQDHARRLDNAEWRMQHCESNCYGTNGVKR